MKRCLIVPPPVGQRQRLRSPTLDAVRAKGYLQCGATPPRRLFTAGLKGVWRGIDVDVCRAVAAAVLAMPTRSATPPLDRATALHRAAVGRDRRAGAQYHVDHTRDNELSGSTSSASTTTTPGLHGREEAQPEKRQAAQRARSACSRGRRPSLNLADYFPWRTHELSGRW